MANINRLFRQIHAADFRPTAEELLELLTFWEHYPFHLYGQRETIEAAAMNPGAVRFVVSGGGPSEDSFEVACRVTGDQITLESERLANYRFGFQMVSLRIADNRFVTPAAFDALHGNTRLIVTRFGLPLAHADVEKVLAPALESRQLDSGAFSRSGVICRHVCQNAPSSNVIYTGGGPHPSRIGPAAATWPTCAGAGLRELHPSDLEAVLATEKNLTRLRIQLELVPPLSPTDARNKFCYEEWQRGQTLMQVFIALKKHPEWEQVSDEKAIRGPIKSWATKHGLPVRKGDRGKPKSAKRS